LIALHCDLPSGPSSAEQLNTQTHIWHYQILFGLGGGNEERGLVQEFRENTGGMGAGISPASIGQDPNIILSINDIHPYDPFLLPITLFGPFVLFSFFRKIKEKHEKGDEMMKRAKGEGKT
jgi:hypothetical protein